MDDGRYYRYAAFLPLGLTTAGLFVALAIARRRRRRAHGDGVMEIAP
jgi:hypothetical protein